MFARSVGRDPSTKGYRSFRATALTLGAVAALGAPSACLERPLCEDCIPRTTNLFVDADSQNSVKRIDLLFMIDNSSSMADKQNVFRTAVPDLVNRLVNPICVTPDGVRQAVTPPPGADCDAGHAREFKPIRDIHVGVITSSLGGHGGPHCASSGGDPVRAEEANDHARLIGSRPRFATFRAQAGEPTEDPHAAGFLDWNPEEKKDQTVERFVSTFEVMTVAADESGCGYEASLESIYRFLVDPNPPEDIVLGKCGDRDCLMPTRRDEVLLAQRAAFLRPDSLVAIIMLSDENDCSIRDTGQSYVLTQSDPDSRPLQKGATVCATNPNDPCCYSCMTGPPAGCAADPVCEDRERIDGTRTNLACFDQKRRLGYDFLYPTARYVNALTAREICTAHADLSTEGGCDDADADGKPDLHPNPLFAGAGSIGRDASLVFFAGIVGVPWQDIRATSVTDEDNNVTPIDPNELRYKTPEVMAKDDTWDLVLGDPHPEGNAEPVPPLDQLMVETLDPRSGRGAAGAEPIAPPSAARMANSVNGHEWNNLNRDDLQYACIFPLPSPEPCDDAQKCDCAAVTDGNGNPYNNPLCQAPDGQYGKTQHFAKAYPGLRQLEVLKGVGKQSIVASICPLQVTDKDAQSYGYRPAVDAIVDRLKARLQGRCLPRRLQKDETGKYPCTVVEAHPGPATCDPSRGRVAPLPGVAQVVFDRMKDGKLCGQAGQAPCDQVTLCAIQEAGPECHQAEAEAKSVGWCYVDPEQNPEDDETLVADCAANEKRLVRFIDPLEQTPADGTQVLIACSGAQFGDGD